jgi:hypothetical protein
MDAAIKQFHIPFNNMQTQAGAFDAGGIGCPEIIIENMRLICFRNAYAIVFNLYGDLIAANLDVQIDGLIVERVFAGIGQQVQ